MAFGTGASHRVQGAEAVRGKQREIACECWFTSTGKITPLMLKIKDEEGVCQTIRPITVRSSEKKMYAGTPSVDFDCESELAGKLTRVWLIYFPNDNRWVMNIR